MTKRVVLGGWGGAGGGSAGGAAGEVVVAAAGESSIADAETMHVTMSEGARGAEMNVIAGEVTVRVVSRSWGGAGGGSAERSSGEVVVRGSRGGTWARRR